jgi:RNA polymerase sigma-70 factor (ECF subfamily)
MALPEPDPGFLLQAVRGEGEGFRHLLDLYAPRVQAIALRYLGSREETQDALQEVFLRLAQRIDRYDRSRPFAPWFLRLATNVIINLHHHRRARLQPGPFPVDRSGERQLEPAVGTPAPPELAATRELRGRLLAGIASLPEAYRQILTLHYVELLSYEEVGEALRLPPGTVKNRLHRARAALGRALHPLRQELEP